MQAVMLPAKLAEAACRAPPACCDKGCPEGGAQPLAVRAEGGRRWPLDTFDKGGPRVVHGDARMHPPVPLVDAGARSDM